ncbi:MAG: M23 family metallopeptidase, partial [Eubacteriales bacterium]
LIESDFEYLREVIYLGQFDSSNRHHVRLVQLFVNYYLGDLAKLGIYSPETEPESGFDIPLAVNNYYNDDTKKALVYLLAYFGRTNIDGERLSDCVDADFFADLAKLEKLPLSNDIIAATRSDGDNAKYNAGYSFDPTYNFIEGAKFALPVDHEPMKSAYFGIRYLPILDGESYDKGVRLHSGTDYRSEDMIVDDVEYNEAHAGESYVDEADQKETEEEQEKTRREIIRDRIYSPYDGVVEYVDDSDVEKGNGIYVRIRHVSKDAEKTVFYSQYLHLSSIMCEVGQVVKRGEVIGTMGNTGYSGGKHLHLEFYTLRMHVSTFINPLIFDYAYEPLKAEALVYEEENGLND